MSKMKFIFSLKKEGRKKEEKSFSFPFQPVTHQKNSAHMENPLVLRIVLWPIDRRSLCCYGVIIILVPQARELGCYLPTPLCLLFLMSILTRPTIHSFKISHAFTEYCPLEHSPLCSGLLLFNIFTTTVSQLKSLAYMCMG